MILLRANLCFILLSVNTTKKYLRLPSFSINNWTTWVKIVAIFKSSSRLEFGWGEKYIFLHQIFEVLVNGKK